MDHRYVLFTVAIPAYLLRMYTLYLAITIPAYLLITYFACFLIDRRIDSTMLAYAMPRPSSLTRTHDEGGEHVVEPERLLPTIEPNPTVAPDLQPGPASAIIEAGPPVSSGLQLEPPPTIIEANPPMSSVLQLEGVARGIGVDVKSLQAWVDEQRRKAAEDDRNQIFRRILASLERTRETRKRRLSIAA